MFTFENDGQWKCLTTIPNKLQNFQGMLKE